jgi:two-component system repressor protein LuxO
MDSTINNLDHSTTILFVDDEVDILASLKRLTRRIDSKCLFASSGAEGLRILEQQTIDVVVSDMKMPEMNGVEFLAQVASSYPETIRIALTGFTDSDMVMGAINDGRIWGYLQKPWDNQQLLISLEQALFTRRLMLERLILQQTVRDLEQFNKSGFHEFIGDSSAMQVVYHFIETAGPSNASIFITGNSGTGKELAANAVHQCSRRVKKPMIALNCAAIPKDLLESEVFGHLKGAFTGAVNNRDGAATLADGGTLFLDELAEMDITLQSKLLRFIQTGNFQKVGSSKTEHADIRFICATNKNPLQAIEQGLLREDLYYRLNVISIDMPDLKERDWDSLILATAFLQKFANKEDKMFIGFNEEAEQLIRNYPWPGNVRQLENCINSIVIMSQGPLVSLADLAQALRIPNDELLKYQKSSRTNSMSLPTQVASNPNMAKDINIAIVPLSEVERNAIEQALSYCSGNVVKAASLLAVSPSTLYRKIQSWEDSSY